MTVSLGEPIEVRAREAMAEAPAVRALDEIHQRAVMARASDVHIEPTAQGGRIRQRVDGILRECGTLAPDLHTHVLSRVKLIAGMDIADKRQPQDGRYDIAVLGHALDVRVSSMPTICGEKLVIRLLERNLEIPSLEGAGIRAPSLERFRSRILAPHGFIVVAGPTGSGKTTTLYAAVAERRIATENICSVEDPVEIRIPGLSQVQVNVRAGVTFASALRGFLRQDPNVIMIGEMRDSETATVAASASLSGQLVLTTLHSNDACSAIERLAELGVSRKTIAAGVSVVVAQRLVRRLCTACRWPQLAGEAVAAELGLSPADRIYAAGSCQRCDESGYRGRCALFEFLFVGDSEREALAREFSTVALRNVALEHGYKPIQNDARTHLLDGDTSVEEIRRIVATGEAA